MKLLSLTFFCLTLSACATTSATQLGHNAFRIEANSNGLISETENQDRALLKAAETTLDAGHRYFIVEHVIDQSVITKFVTPETTVTNIDAVGAPLLGLGVVSAQSTKTVTPSSTTEIKTPKSETKITTYMKRPSPEAHDAREIAMYFGPRLNPLRWGFSTPSKKLLPLQD